VTKIVCVVPLRLNSVRLPGKHLLKINGEHIIKLQRDALIQTMTGAEIIYAIPDSLENDLLAKFLELNDMPFFRGSEVDVFGRLLEAGEKLQADWIIRLNGDNVFIVKDLVDEVLNAITTNKYDLISNVVNRTYPVGCSIEAIRFTTFKEAYTIKDLNESDLEHVTSYFYRNLEDYSYKSIENISSFDFTSSSLALDTRKDYVVLQHLLQDRASSVVTTIELQQIIDDRKKYITNNPFLGKHGVFTISEVGGNHEGNFTYAKKLVTLACSADVDCVKLQVYSPDLLVNKELSPDRHAHFNRFTLTEEQNIELFHIIRNSGKKVSASIWSLGEFKKYKKYIDFVKIGSGDLTDALMLKLVRESDLPVIISTGLSNANEIDVAMATLNNKRNNRGDVAILQCSSMYPIPYIDANLNVMDGYKEAYPGCKVGYSDHTIGKEALAYSVASGAEVLEFHFTDNRVDRDFRDHQVSLTNIDCDNLIKDIITINSLKGSAVKEPVVSELVNGHVDSFRKGVFLKSDMKKGEIVKEEDLITLRPMIGLSATFSLELIGKELNKDIKALSAISMDYFI
jgi:N-acetylneuraminate synthase/N,N'-diacetyllegionaminate synthase